jgi:hypothetical protein
MVKPEAAMVTHRIWWRHAQPAATVHSIIGCSVQRHDRLKTPLGAQKQRCP